jgi:hypothetical protein
MASLRAVNKRLEGKLSQNWLLLKKTDLVKEQEERL